MKRLIVTLFALTIAAHAEAKTARLSPAQRQILHHPKQPFTEVHTRSKLPPAVLELLGGAKDIADPGQRWQVSDAVSEALPHVLLDWAASSGDEYVVHYERGGMARSARVLVATWHKGDKQARLIWFGIGPRKGSFAGFEAFLAALDADALDDDDKIIGP